MAKGKHTNKKRFVNENRMAVRWAGAQKILNFLSRGTKGRVVAGDPSAPQPLFRLCEMYNL
ncbi:hypothetical protein HWC21_gp135 [Vibrio phage VAP7]|uniref:Uncharacterized protein n=1 Tax=Vibrio phage VAP7 TaxID=2584487 RepID=A0A4Y5TXI4_9CAUD|nr:hypothetical protein HWC21_gp135 [Vibrio phage VAP7]QDB73317.1 hypothetical protein [Vibrio phage VAP7]UFD98191.1 hypothetical protein [Vibrio phage BX-1]